MYTRLGHTVGGIFLGAALLIVLVHPADLGEAPSLVCSGGPAPIVEARAAFAYDVQTGTVLFAKNEDGQLPLASLTKMMTALVAHDVLKTDIESETRLMLVTSSNEIADKLAREGDQVLGADGAFVAAMNKMAVQVGLKTTYYLNPTGLDQSVTIAGAYGSARDMAHLIAYGSERGVLLGSAVSHIGAATNTSQTASTLPGSWASKTGYTDLAGGNLAVLFEPVPGRPVAIAVLGSTRDGRDSDVRAIARYISPLLAHGILCNEP